MTDLLTSADLTPTSRARAQYVLDLLHRRADSLEKNANHLAPKDELDVNQASLSGYLRRLAAKLSHDDADQDSLEGYLRRLSAELRYLAISLQYAQVDDTDLHEDKWTHRVKTAREDLTIRAHLAYLDTPDAAEGRRLGCLIKQVRRILDESVALSKIDVA